MTPPRSHEAGVEGLRGFAALSVLYSHFLFVNDIDPQYVLPTHWRIFETSQAAVLLFFILSGYVIGLTNNKPLDAANWGNYLWRRWVRIAPLCWLGLLLSALVRPTPWETVATNAAFIQNYIPYGSWSVPVIKANSNVWTLNYEALYYLLFVLCWARPQAWKAWSVFTVIASVAAWLLPDPWGPLVSCYAVGWFFWLIGYGLSLSKSDAALSKSDTVLAPMPLPWISVLFFWVVTWQEKPLWSVCKRFGLLPREFPDVWVNYSFYDIVPASLLLILAASGRRPAFTRALLWACALIPTLYQIWTLLRGRASLTDPNHFTVFCLLGWALWWWRPDGVLCWRKLAWIGSISYGLYVLQRPVQWFIRDAEWLPAGSPGSFALRLGLAVALTFAVAWVAEKRLQPFIKRKLLRDRGAAAKPARGVEPCR